MGCDCEPGRQGNNGASPLPCLRQLQFLQAALVGLDTLNALQLITREHNRVSHRSVARALRQVRAAVAPQSRCRDRPVTLYANKGGNLVQAPA